MILKFDQKEYVAMVQTRLPNLGRLPIPMKTTWVVFGWVIAHQTLNHGHIFIQILLLIMVSNNMLQCASKSGGRWTCPMTICNHHTVIT